jgi:hypothetical protein
LLIFLIKNRKFSKESLIQPPIHREFGKAKSLAFKDLYEKVSGKIEGQRAKTLSQAGRTVLIKSVVATIPSYVMSTFCYPPLSLLHWTKFSKKFGWVTLKTNLEISL